MLKELSLASRLKYTGASVVDYTAVSASLLDRVSTFRVLELNSFSDHRPCMTTLRIDAPRVTCKDLMDKLDDVPKKFKTTKEGALSAYETRINSPEAGEAAYSLLKTNCFTKNDVICLNGKLVEASIEPASQALPPRRPGAGRGKGRRFYPKQPWFDKECARAKRPVDKNSKLASKPSSNTIREKLYDSKGAYRRLVKQNGVHQWS